MQSPLLSSPTLQDSNPPLSLRVLVTGATGFVGREVLRQLVAAGHHARIVARDPGRARHSVRAATSTAPGSAQRTDASPSLGVPASAGPQTHGAPPDRLKPNSEVGRARVGRNAQKRPPPAGLETRDTADLEVCATFSASEFGLKPGLQTGTPQIIPGNVLQPDTLRGVADGCDAVIHLVGIISEIGEQTFENVHLHATQNVLAEAGRAGVKRWIQMSALGTRPQAVSRYHQTKWLAEEAVRASGLDWTILRPSLIYGPEDHFVNLFASLARWSPVMPVMGNGNGLLQPVSVENVARCFVAALTEPRSLGRTFDLCGPDRLSFNEVLTAILAALGKRRLKLHVPLPLARLQAAMVEALFPLLLRQAPPLNRDQLLMLREDNVGDAGPAEELFQLTQPRFAADLKRYLSAP